MFAQYLVAIDRVHRMHGIALGYRVKSQPAFPWERAKSDAPYYRRGRSRPERQPKESKEDVSIHE
jgi:hypothetical protein